MSVSSIEGLGGRERVTITCPVCGHLGGFNPYLFWADIDPPEGCAEDDAWKNGRLPSITNPSMCPRLLREAAFAAQLRKAAPDCYDNLGNVIPGRGADALSAWVMQGRTIPQTPLQNKEGYE